MVDSSIIIGAIGAFAGVTGVGFTAWPTVAHWRTKHILANGFGSDRFGGDTIERSTKYYVPPDGSSVDPSGEAEIRNVVAAREKLFGLIDRFLSDESEHRHMIVLADSGMGKTSSLLNYYAKNQRRMLGRRYRIAVTPLGLPDTDDYIARIEETLSSFSTPWTKTRGPSKTIADGSTTCSSCARVSEEFS